MKFAIALYSAAHAPSSRRALRFAEAALAGGHEIVRLFFYQDGVHSASSNIGSEICVMFARPASAVARKSSVPPAPDRQVPPGECVLSGTDQLFRAPRLQNILGIQKFNVALATACAQTKGAAPDRINDQTEIYALKH